MNKKMIIREYTESEIKNMGATYILKRKSRFWLIIFIISLIMTIILGKVFQPSLVASLISILPLFVAVALFWYTARKVGQKIWNKIKDKPDPVRFDF